MSCIQRVYEAVPTNCVLHNIKLELSECTCPRMWSHVSW